MEIQIADKDLFDSSLQVNEIRNIYSNNYGCLAAEFVAAIFKNDYLMKTPNGYNIQKYYQEEAERICKSIEEDGIMQRTAWNIAVVTLTAQLLNKLLKFKFDTEKVEQFLISTARENIKKYKLNQPSGTIGDIYAELVKYGLENFKEFRRQDGVFIMGRAFSEFIKEKSYKPIDIKRELSKLGLLKINNGENEYVINQNGTRIKGVFIKINNNQGIMEVI